MCESPDDNDLSSEAFKSVNEHLDLYFGIFH